MTDYGPYFLSQVETGSSSSSPDFISSRGVAWRRQSGNGLFSFLRRAGKQLLRFVGRQAAGLATSVGKSYLENSRLTKEELRDALKSQMREAASDLVEKARSKLQGGSGAAGWRRRVAAGRGIKRRTTKKTAKPRKRRVKKAVKKRKAPKRKKAKKRKKTKSSSLKSRDIFGLVRR